MGFGGVAYAGVLSSHAKWRPLVVPKPDQPAACDGDGGQPAPDDAPPRARGGGCYRPWAELLRRTFDIDVETCPSCGGRMRLLALVTEPASVARLLRHMAEPTEPPPRAPARDPPFWQSRARRHRDHDFTTELGLFEEH
jgi:hypothetical protein